MDFWFVFRKKATETLTAAHWCDDAHRRAPFHQVHGASNNLASWPLLVLKMENEIKAF
jgi:hypothetical protein